MHLRFSLLTFVLAVLPLSVAHAGSCPVCDSSDDCTTSGGAPGFCVLHDAPVGCGDMVMLCCPGQGCAIDGTGRPSCEAAGTCTVVEDLIDAGVPDAGSDAGESDAGGTDAGESDAGESDAGGGTDAGPGTDAGGTGMDAGTAPASTGGCGCRAGQGSLGGLASLLAVAAALLVRRRA